jgi:hypothetical protein
MRIAHPDRRQAAPGTPEQVTAEYVSQEGDMMSGRCATPLAASGSSVAECIFQNQPGLLVQPPPRPPQLVRDSTGFLQHHAVRLEGSVDATGRPPRVVGQGHRCTAEDVHIGSQATPGQPVTEPTERPGNRLPVQQ